MNNRELIEQAVNQYEQAIDDELVNCFLGTKEDFKDAKTALLAIIDWNCGVALYEAKLAQPERLELQEAFARGMACRPASMQPEQAPWCMKMNRCETKCEDCPDDTSPPQPLTVEAAITQLVEALHAQPEQKPVTALYQELLYAVASKYPGESRHHTALRYIRDRECHKIGAPEDAAKQQGETK